MNDKIIPIDSILDEDIEVLEEDFEPITINQNIEPLPTLDSKNNSVKINDVISIDRLFTTDVDEKLQEEAKETIKKEDKRIEKIQLFLILFLLVVGTLIYFFGYDFFEPYIKID